MTQREWYDAILNYTFNKAMEYLHKGNTVAYRIEEASFAEMLTEAKNDGYDIRINDSAKIEVFEKEFTPWDR